VTLWQGRSKGRAAGAAALSEKNIKGANLEIVIPILNKKNKTRLVIIISKSIKNAFKKNSLREILRLTKFIFGMGAPLPCSARRLKLPCYGPAYTCHKRQQFREPTWLIVYHRFG